MIPCDGFESESYDLYALGVLEEEDAAQIRRHLKEQCETCSRALRFSLSLWSAFGAMQAQQSTAQPNRWLRRSAVAIVSAGRRASWMVWGAPAALTMAVIAGAGLAWYLGNSENKASISASLEKDREIHQLQTELEAAQRSAAARPPAALPKTPAELPVQSSRTTSNHDLLRLQSDLQKASAALATSEEALNQSQARAQQLEADLRDQKAQAASLEKEKTDLEARAAAASAENTRFHDTERQATVLRAQVEELQREQVRLQNVIGQQQRQIEQNLQLARVVSSPGLQLVRMRGTESAPKAEAHALVAQGTRVVFYATNLPNLPPGRIYQLWLLRRSNPAIVSGGLFSSTQIAKLEFSDRTLTWNITGLAVTDEPSGGSPLPTGHKFLVGTP